MALATQCPHCKTTFRVAHDQLKLRAGIVRCGTCNEVFDGIAALIDTAAPASQPTDAALPGAVPKSAMPLPYAPASLAFDAEMEALDAKANKEIVGQLYQLDFDTTYEPLVVAPKTVYPQAARAAESAARDAAERDHAAHLAAAAPPVEPEPDFENAPAPELDAAPALPETDLESDLDLDFDFNVDDTPAPGVPDAPSAPAEFDLIIDEQVKNADQSQDRQPEGLEPESSAAEGLEPEGLPPEDLVGAYPSHGLDFDFDAISSAEVPAPVDARASALDMGDTEEPGFVKRERQQRRAGKSRRIIMAIGSVVLTLTMLGQALTSFHNQAAAHFPQLKPMLVSACAMLGCRIELPAQIDVLTIETGELQTLGGNAFSFTTLLRNQGALTQTWPHIELVLSDANDKALVRRVFTPSEYLTPPLDPAKGFGARSEQGVRLSFELDQIKASGYHIAIFYP